MVFVFSQDRQVVVGMSANSEEGVEREALNSGMDAFIPVRGISCRIAASCGV